MIAVAPSLLSANFAWLEQDLNHVNQSCATQLHLDVMDGVFVPNISFGFPVLKHVARLSEKPLDVHLMIVDPLKFIREVKALGAKYMNVHYEAISDPISVAREIRSAGMLPAITLKPATPVSVLSADMLQEFAMVLLMSVEPGFGGQKFIPETLDKVRELRKRIAESGSSALIEVDGGVNMQTGALLSEAGADILVAGSAVFGAPEGIVNSVSELSNL